MFAFAKTRKTEEDAKRKKRKKRKKKKQRKEKEKKRLKKERAVKLDVNTVSINIAIRDRYPIAIADHRR